MASFLSKKAKGFIIWGFGISVSGLIAVLMAGYGYQWGLWHFSFGFTLIPWGTGAAVLGGLIATIGLFKLNNKTVKLLLYGIISMLIAVAAIANIGYWYNEIQQGYPPIHDITTNTDDPPEFVSIAPLRADAPNPVEYAGEEAAKAQQDFYGNIDPIRTSLSYDEAYSKALRTARNMPWELVVESRQEGRIEAYHKLAWFGFIDDVVIRVDTAGAGSIIDLRSKSRIGRGDLGVNAKRIQAYKKAFGE